MADGASFDFSDVLKLAADIGEVADDVEKPVKTALNVTSMRVKKGAQQKVRRRKHFAQAAQAITFDVTATRSGIESEIGYEKGRGAGKLGNLIEFGAPGAANALTPGNELQRTLQEEQEDFTRGLEIALDDVMKAKGL